MSEITEISRRAWNATKMPTQPEFDGLAREFVLQLESRAEGVMATGLASEGDEVLARFEQAVKGIVESPNEAAAEVVAEPEQNTMAMAAPIPEDVKEELVEEAVEEKVEPLKKKPRKVQKREPQVPRKPKIIKAAVTRGHATTTKKPALVAKKK